ncbi:hypothetical protein [Agrobacterium pusense]|uniref:hypothetical protein n=1 Tax=Agrobacterium pusense TaxID=648995 RepID=UPI003FD6637D
MRLAKSRDVLRLTGLTSDQLREWTVRRALIVPDVPAQKRGSEAQFSWQTVLLLRLAVVLRSRFHVELQAHRDLLAAVRNYLNGRSFPSLWGFTLAVSDDGRCQLLGPTELAPLELDLILLRLDPHLQALSEGFEQVALNDQLPLFSAISVSHSVQRRHATISKGAAP